jgi:purine-binding chemotaxis protein CheW
MTPGSQERNADERNMPPPVIARESEQANRETVWRERAVRLAKRLVVAGVGQDTRPWMVLGIGSERYGIELADVAEVLAQVQITPVPGTPRHLAGVINVRGEIRPVADLRRLLGIDAAETGTRARVILIRLDGREMGLQVDSVEHIRWVAAGDLRSPSDGDAGLSARFLKGWTGDTLMLLNTEALFAEPLKGNRS